MFCRKNLTLIGTVSVDIVARSLRSFMDIVSVLYRLVIGWIACLIPCCVVTHSVFLAVSIPIAQCLDKFSADVSECRFSDTVSDMLIFSRYFHIRDNSWKGVSSFNAVEIPATSRSSPPVSTSPASTSAVSQTRIASMHTLVRRTWTAAVLLTSLSCHILYASFF